MDEKTYPANEFLKLVNKEAELNKTSNSKDFEDLKKIQYCVDIIRKIDAQYSDIKQNNIDAFDFYYGVNYMKDVEGRSKVYTSDLADTVEWVLPALMKIFASGDDVTALQPRKQEYAKQVENHNELVNYQLKVKNNWFIILNDWFKDALLLKRGAVKRQWYVHKDEDEKEFEGATEEELVKYASEKDVKAIKVKKENIVSPAAPPQFDPQTGQEVPGAPEVKSYDGIIEYEFEDEYPLVEAVPSEEYGFPVDTRDIENCSFFYHRVKYDEWAFKNRFGEKAFNKAKELKDSFLDITDDLSVDQERFVDINGVAIKFFFDINQNKWLVYECYFPNPDNGKPWVRAICGNQLLEDKRNKYKMPPFRLLTPIKLSHRIIGVSMYDLLKDLQKIRTSLLRQMLDTGYQNLNGRWVIDPTRISFEDFLKSNRPGGVIRTKDGNPADEKSIREIQGKGLPSFSFELYETISKEKDYHTGVPRSFQGVNTQVLNKTMRGQNQQVQQAQQRIEMMARLFAEMGIAPLVSDIVDMNSRFMKKETALKVVNDWIVVTPEDVNAKADVIINVGLGTGNKDIVIGQMQQLIGIYLQLQSSGFNVAGSEQVHNAMKELVKAMGYRNVDDYVANPKSLELLTQLLQTLLSGMEGGNQHDPQQMIPLIEKIGQEFGIFPKQGKGQGTQEGATPGAVPEQGANPMNNPEAIPTEGYFG